MDICNSVPWARTQGHVHWRSQVSNHLINISLPQKLTASFGFISWFFSSWKLFSHCIFCICLFPIILSSLITDINPKKSFLKISIIIIIIWCEETEWPLWPLRLHTHNMHSRWFSLAATWSGVSPWTFTAFRSHRASSRAWAMSSQPDRAAQCRQTFSS